MKNYGFIRDTSFKDLDGGYELDTGSVSTEHVSLNLSLLRYTTRSAGDRSDSVRGVLSKSDTKNAVKLMGSIIASGAHGHIFRSILMFDIWAGAFLLR